MISVNYKPRISCIFMTISSGADFFPNASGDDTLAQ